MPRMPRVSTRGPSGVATVQLGKKDGNNVAKVIFEEGDTFYIQVAKNTVPPYLQKGQFFVQLGKDRRTITSMRPLSGQMKGKVKNFVAREGEQPVPQVRNGNYGPYEVFNVILSITEPEKYKGMEVFLQLPFKFVAAPVKVNDENHDVVAIPVSKSKSVEMLDNFVMATRATAKSYIPWSDNPLPTMQKRILREQAEFTWLMKDGWVSAILPPDLNEDFGEPEVPADESLADFGEPEEADEFVSDGDEDEFSTSDEPADAPWDDVVD